MDSAWVRPTAIGPEKALNKLAGGVKMLLPQRLRGTDECERRNVKDGGGGAVGG